MSYHTNIRHQEIVAILGTRNLPLRLVYAHIANYTQVKGAWCGARQKLADEIEIDRTVASRKLDELITRGLVIAEGDNYRAVCIPERAECTEERAERTEERAECTEKRAERTEKRAERTEISSPVPPINNKINNNIKINNSSSLADTAATPPQLSSLSSFIPPSENEVLAYANHKKIPEMVARKFHQYYQGNGWYLRKGQKMKVWRSVLDYWWSTEQKDQQTRAVTMIQAGGRGQIIQTDRDREIEEIVRKQREADKARRAQEEASLTDEDILANQQIGLKRTAQMNKDDPRAKMRTNETPHGW